MLQYPRTQNTQHILALLTLAAINIITFHHHYAGEATFPWDFLGGYHFQTYGWFSNGSLLNPPAWFPWGGIGFPSALAVQSGAWYLPISLIDLFGINYSIQVATSIQCLSIFFGSAGMYLLLRLFGSSISVSIVGAICFHFSAGFFSNQQHVDIIRGYALLPWLLVAINPTFAKIKYSTPIAAIVLFQFLVAAYPGIIVSSFYTCVVIITAFLLGMDRLSHQKYILHIGLMSVLGIALALLKWLPFLMEHSAVPSLGNSSLSPFTSEHLLTLLLPYDADFLPGDVTMRSLFLPIIAVWGIFFVKKLDGFFFIGFLMVSSVLIISLLTTLGLLHYLPGGTISRFPLSDWRGHFHIGFIIMAASGWTTLFNSELEVKQIIFRTALFLIASSVLMLCAVSVGYEHDATANFVFRTVIMILFSSLLILLSLNFFSRYRNILLVTLLILLGGIDGLNYHKDQNRVWNLSWSKEAESALFGINFNEIVAKDADEISRRPARIVIGSDIQSVLANSLSTLYNKCWYEKSYCLLGYNNLKYSTPHNTIIGLLAEDNEKSRNLLSFLSRPSQLVIVSENNSIDLLSLPESTNFIANPEMASGNPLVYSSEKIVYEISLKQDAKIIENEIWWGGWKYRYCRADSCGGWIDTQHTQEFLRSMNVPKGEYTLEIEYHQKGRFASQVIALFAILIILLILIRTKNAAATA